MSCSVLHTWNQIAFTGMNQYSECAKCGDRKVENVSNDGYQPIHRDWLNHKVASFKQSLMTPLEEIHNGTV
jgi:hypothetical protein